MLKFLTFTKLITDIDQLLHTMVDFLKRVKLKISTQNFIPLSFSPCSETANVAATAIFEVTLDYMEITCDPKLFELQQSFNVIT